MHTIPPNICSLDIPKTSLTIEVKATLDISGNIDLHQFLGEQRSKYTSDDF